MKSFLEFLNENSIVDYEAIRKRIGKDKAEECAKLEPTHKCIKEFHDYSENDLDYKVLMHKGDIVNWNTKLEIITVLRGKNPGYQVFFEIEKHLGDKIENYIAPLTAIELKTMTNNYAFGI